MTFDLQALQVPACAMPPGYEIRAFGPGDRHRWLDLLNAHNEFGVLTPPSFERDVTDLLISGGGVGVFHAEDLIATASVCDLPAFRPAATLMFVVVDPRHRGLRLGTASTAAAMSVAAEAGYPSVVLHTDDHRDAALRTYLGMGFEPALDHSADAPERWAVVLARIRD
jgi:ribosomal protein S18 acetylase RimI-like enzyme